MGLINNVQKMRIFPERKQSLVERGSVISREARGSLSYCTENG